MEARWRDTTTKETGFGVQDYRCAYCGRNVAASEGYWCVGEHDSLEHTIHKARPLSYERKRRFGNRRSLNFCAASAPLREEARARGDSNLKPSDPWIGRRIRIAHGKFRGRSTSLRTVFLSPPQRFECGPRKGDITATKLPRKSAPERIRTTNLLIRSQMLYPVELRAPKKNS